MDWVVGIAIVIFVVYHLATGTTPPLHDREKEGIKRVGRVGLWVVLPPVGLWRSVRHGQRKRDERLAELINQKDKENRGS